MGGEEQELHAADEVGAGHHQERRVAEAARAARALGDSPPRLAPGAGSATPSTRPAIQAAGSMPSASTSEAQHARAPAMVVGQDLAERRRQQRAQRTRGGDDAQHGAAHAAGHGARAHGQRHRRGRAGERHADQHARAQHHAHQPSAMATAAGLAT